MFHSEYGQDEWLVRNCFGDVWGGTFVEAGALDGIYDSNTLHLERERGWRGILIEPNPEQLIACKANRPRAVVVGCALSDVDGEFPFEIVTGTYRGWSGFAHTGDGRRQHSLDADGTRRLTHVRARPLADILREYALHRVDYLSLDVEGAELEVLGVYPFDEIPIGIIGVEDNTGKNEALRTLLAERGYVHMARVGVDDFWRRDH